MEPDLSHEYFMKMALREAHEALEEDEIPIGAVVVCNNSIIARAHNLSERLHDVTAHAEMQAFTAASGFLGGKYLNECILYVTIEPCLMCAGAAFWTQLNTLVYGASDPLRGFRQVEKKAASSLLHPKTKVVPGILQEECSLLLKNFFSRKR